MKNKLDELLVKLEEGATKIKAALAGSLHISDMPAYHALGAEYGITALATYKALNGNVRIHPEIAINRYNATPLMPNSAHLEEDNYRPDQLEFWVDTDAIVELYESLKAGGYYADA